jgi:hypothetical protein
MEAMNRQRVQHREYKWLGEINEEDGLPVDWYRVKWDDGRETTEHEEDLISREVNA